MKKIMFGVYTNRSKFPRLLVENKWKARDAIEVAKKLWNFYGCNQPFVKRVMVEYNIKKRIFEVTEHSYEVHEVIGKSMKGGE